MKAKPHLFPHSYLPEAVLRRLIFLFGPARIYQPWFLGPPGFFNRYELEVIYPPDELKPSGDFKVILSSYHSWAEQNLDRSFKESVKFRAMADMDKDAIWEIRRFLRGAGAPVQAEKAEGRALKQHLLLHLADDIERQQYELMDMMEKMMGKPPVLKGVLNEPDEAKGIFAYTDDINTSVPEYSPNLPSLVDAWFGLFGGYLKDKELLITCNRPVMEYILSQWDENSGKEDTGDIRRISFCLHDSLSDEDILKIRELIFGFGEETGRCMNELLLLTKNIEEQIPQDPSNAIFEFQLVKFPSIHCEESFEANDLLRNVAGKSIILMTSV